MRISSTADQAFAVALACEISIANHVDPLLKAIFSMAIVAFVFITLSHSLVKAPADHPLGLL